MKLEVLGILLERKVVYVCLWCFCVHVVYVLGVNSNHAGILQVESLSRSLSGPAERGSNPTTTCTAHIPSTEEFCLMYNFVHCNIAGPEFSIRIVKLIVNLHPELFT